MRIVAASEVRAAIATHMLGGRRPECLGDVVLHDHQREGAERIARLLEDHGGALLADDVGLGKTYVALALARDSQRPLVIAPAALREGWAAAAGRAGVRIEIHSGESLSRGDAPRATPDLVIVDEAHHLRNARTRRFAAASTLCRGAKVLLLSATPIQNRLQDLRSVLSLFLGERANAMEPEALAAYVVRRGERDVTRSLALPTVREPEWIRSMRDVDCLDRLAALPAPLPASDADDGGVLLLYSLVRQWASSRAALRLALRRRLARARAMEDALAAGRLPSRAELTAWCFADGAQQLSFPELVVASHVHDAPALLARVRTHAERVGDLLQFLDGAADADADRVEAIRAVLARHPGERVVAFTEFTETARSLFRRLSTTVRAAVLTHDGCRIAGGRMTRRELLARFAPGAAAVAKPGERIDLLLTTDVLSEGVDLHDASVVVHLDLSWNPARLEQRVGRLRRIGATRDSVTAYAFAPPAPAERMLQLEHRLRLKLGTAARSLGVAGAILPGFVFAGDAAVPREERIVAAMRSWRAGASAPTDAVVAAARTTRDGALALVRIADAVMLIAVSDGCVSEARASVEALVECSGGDDVAVDAAEMRPIVEQIDRWMRRRLVSDVVNLPALRVARSRRTVLHRVAGIARRTARHEQPRLGPLMHAARSAASVPLSAGAERVLDELARAALPDDAWLHAIGEFATVHARPVTPTPQVLALLLLRAP